MALGRKTGGRKPGSLNKTTADVKALAQAHTAAAIGELVRLALHSENDSARVAAIKELLDRGHGKARQPIIGGDDSEPPVKMKLAVSFVASAETSTGL